MNDVSYDAVMIDLETLGTGPDAPILQVSAIRFQARHGGKVDNAGAFNLYVGDRPDALPGLSVADPGTLAFWLTAEAPARRALAEGIKNSDFDLTEVLAQFSFWMRSREFDTVWAKPSNFDLSLLAGAYRRSGHNPPWDHWQTMCSRTAMRVLRHEESSTPVLTGAVLHNAVDDCLRQIACLQHALGKQPQ